MIFLRFLRKEVRRIYLKLLYLKELNKFVNLGKVVINSRKWCEMKC